MDESFNAHDGESLEPKIVRYQVDMFINGEKDTSWEITDLIDLEDLKNDLVKKNPDSTVTFSEPKVIEEDLELEEDETTN